MEKKTEMGESDVLWVNHPIIWGSLKTTKRFILLILVFSESLEGIYNITSNKPAR